MRNVFVFILLTSCAHQTFTTEGITSVVKQNEILAYKDYLHSNIFITGQILDIGVDSKLDEAVTKSLSNSASTYVYKKDDGSDLHPFIVISDNGNINDISICFFDFDDAEYVTKYRRGDIITLYGMIYRFITVRGKTVVVLDNCEDS